jgi:hypothetical protein
MMRRSGVPESEVRKRAVALGIDAEAVNACWPDHAQSLSALRLMSTQWSVGAQGVVLGMRYEALGLVFEALGVKKKDYREALDALQVMEQEVLQIFNRKRNG